MESVWRLEELMGAWHGSTCNPSTQEAEAGGLRVQGQSALHNETLFKKIKKRVNSL
jgi:hypothetical protein